MPISSNIRNTYQSQFVPLPLEIFARANERDQKIQDAQVAQASDTSDALWKVKGAANEDNEYVNNVKTKYDEAASMLVNKDLTQRENQDAVKSLIKTTARDPTLNTIMANKAKYDEWVTNVQKAKEEGNYTPENDMGSFSYANYIKNGGYKSGKGIDSTVMKYMEERPKMEQFFNDMGENGSDSLAKAGETYYKNGWSGITSDRVNKQALDSFGGYINTPEGQQGMRRFELLSPDAQKKFKGGANEYVFKQFLDAGLERVHGKSTSGRAEALNADRKEKKADAKEKAEAENLFQNNLIPETPSTLTNGRPIKFLPNGQIDGAGINIFEQYKKTGLSMNTIKEWWNSDTLDDEESKDFKHITVGAKLNGVTPEQYAKVYNKTTHMKVDKPLIGKALDQNNKVLFNNGAGVWSHLNVMNTKTGEKGMNFLDAVNKIADEQGWELPDPKTNPKEFGEYIKSKGLSITGQANPNEFSLNPVIFTFGDNTLAADMTFGGKQLPYDNSTAVGKAANKKAKELANYDKLQKGQQVIEKIDGEDVIFYKDMKTGKIEPKKLKDLKD